MLYIELIKSSLVKYEILWATKKTPGRKFSEVWKSEGSSLVGNFDLGCNIFCAKEEAYFLLLSSNIAI